VKNLSFNHVTTKASPDKQVIETKLRNLPWTQHDVLNRPIAFHNDRRIQDQPKSPAIIHLDKYYCVLLMTLPSASVASNNPNTVIPKYSSGFKYPSKLVHCTGIARAVC